MKDRYGVSKSLDSQKQVILCYVAEVLAQP